MKSLRKPLLTVCATLLFARSAVGQKIAWPELVRTHSYELTPVNGHLGPDGLAVLLKDAERTQFYLIAEEHNVREIPEFTTMLFRELHGRYGYQHLALELGPVMGRLFSAKGTVGDLDAVKRIAQGHPAGLAFRTDEELRMIAEVGRLSSGPGRAIWGLDQAFGGLHILEELLPFAPTDAARTLTVELIELARQAENVDDKHFYLELPKGEKLSELRSAYSSVSKPQVSFLLDAIRDSQRIYDNYTRGTRGLIPGYFENNREREQNMKKYFMQEYAFAKQEGATLPRVMIKMGHWHMYRGMFRARIPTLGNFVSEFATSNGLESLSIAVHVRWEGLDGDVVVPLSHVANPEAWTLVDLRPIRHYLTAKKVDGEVEPGVQELIYGFDFLLVIRGARQGSRTMVPPLKPPANSLPGAGKN